MWDWLSESDRMIEDWVELGLRDIVGKSQQYRVVKILLSLSHFHGKVLFIRYRHRSQIF